MHKFMQTVILDADGARAYIDALHKAGKLYHFDDSPESIYEIGSGARTFTDEEAEAVAARTWELFDIPGFCPFEYALTLIE